MSACRCGCGGNTKSKYVLGHNSRVAHPMQGRTHSEEARKKIRDSRVGKPSSTKGTKKTEEQKEKMAEAMKLRWQDPDFRVRVLAARKGKQAGENHPMFGKHHSTETRQRLREAGLGRPGPMVGRKHNEETREKMSKSHKGVPLSEEHNRNAHAARTRNGYRHTAETLRKIGNGNRGKVMSEEAKRKCSVSAKLLWRNPDHAKKCLVINSPNKAEIKLMGVLDAMYPAEWKFVGDGQVVIGGKCPDFINVNGAKRIIELYGKRWHQHDDPQDRIDMFKPYGYETLVIWDKELGNMKTLKQSIALFCGSE